MTETNFDHWGIVELMGHQRAAGRMRAEQIAGGQMLRVDIPSGEGFRTAYYGSSAIYALHITDEKAARLAAARSSSAPPFAWQLEGHLRQLEHAQIEDPDDEQCAY